MTKKVEARLDDLERDQVMDKPQILACESLREPGIYTVSEIGVAGAKKERMTLDEIQTKYSGRVIVRMIHTYKEPANDGD